ncbi:MAG: iron-sulfur cluster repair di-iron protein, partial [Bacteroidales bacterium]|nr:iron-sulfur cluster repair di-iron protein [Bacteroidales bacterium]
SHMNKEESILFPYIQKMVKSKNEGSVPDPPPFGQVANPVRMMISEHENEGRRFGRIAEISGNFTPPADACTSYRTTFKQLEDFERDLHRHIHLENNILFPDALGLEKDLNGLKNK